MSVQRQPAAIARACLAVVLALVGLLMMPSCSDSTQSAHRGDSRSARSDSVVELQDDRAPTPRTLLAMADILAAQGKDKECEFVLSTCIQQHPDFVPAHNSLAGLKIRHGRVAEAASVLSNALRRWPNDSVLLNNLGMCFLIRRDYETSLEYFTRAAAHAPESEKYRANMATSLGMQGRHAEALALLRQILPEEQAIHNAQVLKRARQKATGGSESAAPKQVDVARVHFR